jgi:hypothetical protein
VTPEFSKDQEQAAMGETTKKAGTDASFKQK